MEATPPQSAGATADRYPIQFEVEYPDRQLNRLTTFFRVITILPILFLLSTISGFSITYGDFEGEAATFVIGGVGLLFLPVLLTLLFRERYPRWWFDWNLNLQRFVSRIGVYAALMDDRYPATEEEQSVRLTYYYPNVQTDLHRALPLVKWLLALPHHIVLAFLYLGVFFAAIAAWFAILFTGRYPRGLFNYIEGVMRWHNRVVGYAFTLVTDRYPPFRLRP